MLGKSESKEYEKWLETWMDKMKEIQRIQYDYFKYMITLSTGSILIIIAILEKVFAYPRPLVMILIMASFVGFALTIVFSLSALPNTGNLILYINGIQKAIKEKNKENAEDFDKKKDDALNNIGICGKGVFWSYVSGIAILLISVGLYFFD